MIKGQLSGCDTASACGIERKGRGMSGPIGPLCRDLIEAGYAAHDMIAFYRGDAVSLLPARLSWYAERTCSEGVYTPLGYKKYNPFEKEQA